MQIIFISYIKIIFLLKCIFYIAINLSLFEFILIRKKIMEDYFVDYCGITLTENSDGSFIGTVDLEKKHLNANNVVHGGMLLTLADTTGRYNCKRVLKMPVTINSDFHFFKNTGSGRITCTTTILHAGKKLATIKVHIYDEKNTLLCEGTFTYYDVSK